ncbi:DUF4279 domain-containing protein [Reyranella sp. CPCC 100927]|uniref:DUF4279 domain-containing protein n=1 Tax=Reyranella sp. CPCC 100927 TaxID=2599616 RepID=UPI002107ECBF|nr:DUF4279 domain-containing protein [Reyranella sp. CPCC 100927]
MDPAQIDTALKLEGRSRQRAGDPRKTPNGTPLPGTYRDSRWRHAWDYQTTGQHFVNQIETLIDGLESHKVFLEHLRSTGGQIHVIVQFLGDKGYFGDSLPHHMLARLVELGVDLDIECYTVPQTSMTTSG